MLTDVLATLAAMAFGSLVLGALWGLTLVGNTAVMGLGAIALTAVASWVFEGDWL